MSKKKQIPLVSVYMITYNHAPFIAQALDSVLEQKTNFDYKIVIGDDCSTDGTSKIIADYQEKHPGKIRVITSETNIGAKLNSVRTLKACSGKYIATLEGDDYWNDPFKLQKQLDFLEFNQGCSLCYTNRYIVDEKNSILSEGNLLGKKKAFLLKEDVIGIFTPPTPTIMFHGKYVTPTLLSALKGSYNGDTTLSYFLIREGAFGYIDEITACYRQHTGGVCSKIENIKRLEETLLNYREIKKYFTEKDRVLLNRENTAILMRLYKEYFYSFKLLKCLKTTGLLIINDIRFLQLNFLRANYWLFKGR